VLGIVQAGRRAVGVNHARGGHRHPRADSAVIVTSDAIGSPRLMLLSGGRTAAQLQAHGITVAQDLVEPDRPFRHRPCGRVEGDESHLPMRQAAHGALDQSATDPVRHGPVTSNLVVGRAFLHADRSAAKPDLQFHCSSGAGRWRACLRCRKERQGRRCTLTHAPQIARFGQLALG
jgi:choline dehydrogenase-like flavoprotein